MSKKPAVKKGGKGTVDTDKLTPDQILIEYVKLNNAEEIEKLFEQYLELDCNFNIMEEVKKESESRPSSKQNSRSASSMKKNAPSKKAETKEGEDKSEEEVETADEHKEEEVEKVEKVVADTPFTLAVRLGFVDVAKCLVEHNANVNAKARNDDTCLHIAVDSFKEDEELLKFLLHIETTKANRKVIVDRNAKNSKGESAVLSAVLQCKLRAAGKYSNTISSNVERIAIRSWSYS
jgi:hypothetical protein